MPRVQIQVVITRSEVEQPGQDCSSSKEQPDPGRLSDRGWTAKELCFNVTTTRSRLTADAIAAGRLPPCRARQTTRAARSRQTAEAIEAEQLPTLPLSGVCRQVAAEPQFKDNRYSFIEPANPLGLQKTKQSRPRPIKIIYCRRSTFYKTPFLNP